MSMIPSGLAGCYTLKDYGISPKRRFSTFEDAQAFRNEHPKDRTLGAYHCRNCGFFHVGHSASRSKKSAPVIAKKPVSLEKESAQLTSAARKAMKKELNRIKQEENRRYNVLRQEREFTKEVWRKLAGHLRFVERQAINDRMRGKRPPFQDPFDWSHAWWMEEE